jgi:hypothetical protein
MRGYDRPQATMLTLVNPEKRVPANHPIRLIKALAELALKELSPLFEQMYSEVGRPSIPPEVARRSIRALPVGRDTRSISACASGSRRSSAGSRRSGIFVAPAIEAWSGPPSPHI